MVIQINNNLQLRMRNINTELQEHVKNQNQNEQLINHDRENSITLSNALELTDEARVIVVSSVPREIISVNKSFCILTGYGSTDLIGSTIDKLFGDLTDRNKVLKMNEKMSSLGVVKTNLVCYRNNGSEFFCGITATPIIARDYFEEYRLTHFVLTWKEIPFDQHKLSSNRSETSVSQLSSDSNPDSTEDDCDENNNYNNGKLQSESNKTTSCSSRIDNEVNSEHPQLQQAITDQDHVFDGSMISSNSSSRKLPSEDNNNDTESYVSYTRLTSQSLSYHNNCNESALSTVDNHLRPLSISRYSLRNKRRVESAEQVKNSKHKRRK